MHERLIIEFKHIDNKKPEEHKKKIGEGDIMKVLNYLGQKPSKAEVKLIIWVRLILHLI